MLAYVKGIDRLAISKIQVKHFSTHDLIGAKSCDLAQDILPLMTANDFDAMPLGDTLALSFIQRDKVSTLSPCDPVSMVGECVKSEQLIKDTVPFTEALGVLQEHSWFFVTKDGKQLNGIVTSYDLARPSISLYIFARIISLEHGLRRLLGTYTNTPIPDNSPTEQKPDDSSQLFELFKKVQSEKKLVEDLKYASKNAFKKATGFIVGLRNNLAHGQSILNIAVDARNAVDHIGRVDELVKRVSELAEDRDQIWRAFLDTHIVQQEDERVWSGPGAISLPWPPPVHIINACNPFEQVFAGEKNEKRNNALQDVLTARQLKFKSVIGRSSKGSWTEPSFAIHGLSREEACVLASRFGQRAIFEMDDDELRVISVEGEIRGTRPRAKF